MPPVDGTGANGVCLLGEAWGEKEEARQGTPFVGPAGFRLERMVQQLGASRAEFLLTNTVWARPPHNREPTPLEVEVWRPQWEAAIRDSKITVVVPLGNVPLRAVTGHWGITDRRGYLEWSERLGCWVLPTVHPSFIMRGKANWTAAWLRDVEMALQVAQDGPPQAPERLLSLDPLLTGCWAWSQAWLATGAPLAVDIETPDKGDDEEEAMLAIGAAQGVILRVGLAYCHQNRTHALSIPWGAAYSSFVQSVLASARPALVWNRHFDVPRLRAHHCTAPEWRDVQEAWHVFHPDLPKKLAFAVPFLVPGQPYWKDQASERPAYYNAVDAAVTAEGYHVLWAGSTTPA